MIRLRFKSLCLTLFLSFFGMLLVPQNGNASGGYKLLDSIEEFGEKRYIRPTPARLQKGPVIFHPTLRTKVEYDDNILLEDNDAREDVIFDIRPGMVIEIPVDTHQLAVGYEADFENFTKRTDQNDQNQDIFALLDISFPSWYINVLEKFSETSGRSGTTFTSRIPRFDNSINPKVGYRWKRMTVEAGYRNVLRDFRKNGNDPLDYELNEWTGVVYFDLFARLKALVEYNVAQIDYDDDFKRNGTFQQARVGLEGEIIPNLLVKLRTGPHWRDYEERTRNQLDYWVADVLVEYHLRDNLSFNMEFTRTAAEATLFGSNYYKEHSLSIGGTYEFKPKWTLFGEARYYRHDYSERSTVGARVGFRHDDHYNVETGIKYLFREWLEFEMAYNFRRRDSNFSVADYTNNRFSISSSLFY